MVVLRGGAAAAVLLLLAIPIATLAYAFAEAAPSSTSCYDSSYDEGSFSVSYASIYATYGIGFGNARVGLAVKDKYVDGLYLAARFVIEVDGVRTELLFGVPDGGFIAISRYEAFQRYVRATAQGYLGLLDSTATAYISSSSCTILFLERGG